MNLLAPIFFLLFAAAAARTTQIPYPAIPETGAAPGHFVPARYTPLDTLRTDFNHDGADDFALVLQGLDSVDEMRSMGGEEWLERQQPRILLVCFAHNGRYRLVERSNSFILRAGEGGMFDPFEGLATNAHNDLVIDFYGGTGWRWRLAYTFRYQEDKFRLIAAESVSYHSGEGTMDSWSYNFSAGKVVWVRGNMFAEDAEDTSTELALDIPLLRTFDDFRQPGSWRISADLEL